MGSTRQRSPLLDSGAHAAPQRLSMPVALQHGGLHGASGSANWALAICDAKLGDYPSALRHFRKAEPRLRAVQAKDLLERCQEALGL